MKHRSRPDWRTEHDDVNRGDYRGDFGPEGHRRFGGAAEHTRHEHQPGHDGRRRFRHDRDAMLDPNDHHGQRHAGGWSWRRFGREGWQRSRDAGGYGSQFGAWSSGAGLKPAGFGFGPEEEPASDHDWQPTRPARGRGAWAGDWDQSDYRGRGPKGYRRSDERIRDEVCERLTDDRRVDASEITVEVKDGEVTLTGRVPTRDQKRQASECVEDIPGVREVFNQLQIDRAYAGGHRSSRDGSR